MNAKLLYLVCPSGVFPLKQTMHTALKGSSAAGKSNLVEAVLKFMPPEVVMSFNAISEKAPFYFKEGEALEHKILYMGEARWGTPTHSRVPRTGCSVGSVAKGGSHST